MFGLPTITWGEVRNEYRSAKPHFVAIVQHAVHFCRRIEKARIVAILKICLATGLDDRDVAIHYHVARSCHLFDLRTAGVVIPVRVAN